MYSCRAVFAFVLVLGSVGVRGLISDCADLYRQGNTKDGVYTIAPKQSSFTVYCDMTTDGGGWTVFQKRFDGSVDFYLDWAAYKKGFGDPSGEFWLGNDKINILTTQKKYKIRVDLIGVNNVAKYAVYDLFSISPESDKYRLKLGSYSGTAGDSLSSHNGKAFTTKDRDNDPWPYANCAVIAKGAWWYDMCAISNLNGVYTTEYKDDNPNYIMEWRYFDTYIKSSEMKIRPVDFK